MQRTVALLLAVLSFALVAACLPVGSRGPGPASTGRSDGNGSPAVAPTPSGPAPSRTIVPPTPTPAPTFLVYTVRTGDSLNTIAHRFGTTARSIALWNRTSHPSLDPAAATYRPNRLDVGWTLVLVPNDIVDEQDLPDPSPAAGPSIDPAASDPAATAATGSASGATTGWIS